MPANWKLTGLQCTSQSGHSTTSTDLATATVSIDLADEDTVTCTYTDEFVTPNGGLEISKLTVGGTGRFGFTEQPSAGGHSETAVAETLQPEVAVDAAPSPISLAPGDYKLSETAPASSAGRWSLTGVECGGHMHVGHDFIGRFGEIVRVLVGFDFSQAEVCLGIDEAGIDCHSVGVNYLRTFRDGYFACFAYRGDFAIGHDEDSVLDDAMADC